MILQIGDRQRKKYVNNGEKANCRLLKTKGDCVMDDINIVEMFRNRNEDAIREAETKYGAYCHSIAYGFLGDFSDSEECVNDTFLRAWDSIPPHRPSMLRGFLGKLTRYSCITCPFVILYTHKIITDTDITLSPCFYVIITVMRDYVLPQAEWR